MRDISSAAHGDVIAAWRRTRRQPWFGADARITSPCLSALQECSARCRLTRALRCSHTSSRYRLSPDKCGWTMGRARRPMEVIRMRLLNAPAIFRATGRARTVRLFCAAARPRAGAELSLRALPAAARYCIFIQRYRFMSARRPSLARGPTLSFVFSRQPLLNRALCAGNPARACAVTCPTRIKGPSHCLQVRRCAGSWRAGFPS